MKKVLFILLVSLVFVACTMNVEEEVKPVVYITGGPDTATRYTPPGSIPITHPVVECIDAETWQKEAR